MDPVAGRWVAVPAPDVAAAAGVPPARARGGDVAAWWLARSEDRLPVGLGWLTATESSYAGGLRFAKRRTGYLLRRLVVKEGVATLLGLPAGAASLARLEVGNRPSGAPYVLLDGAPCGLAVSITDRAGWAVCVLTHDGSRDRMRPRTRRATQSGLHPRPVHTRRSRSTSRLSPTPAPRRGGEPGVVGEGERAQGAPDRAATRHPQRGGYCPQCTERRLDRADGQDRRGPGSAGLVASRRRLPRHGHGGPASDTADGVGLADTLADAVPRESWLGRPLIA